MEGCGKFYGSQRFVNGPKKESTDVVFGIFWGGLKKTLMSMWVKFSRVEEGVEKCAA